VGDLEADSSYNVVIDGVVWDSFIADTGGMISFSYQGDYNDRVFEVVKTP
jgi:hypothetical protein